MGSDEWETDSWKKGQKKEKERVKKINEKTKIKAEEYIKYFLDSMTEIENSDEHSKILIDDIIKILNWKGEEVSRFYK
jgi:hypothetical protein